MKKLIQKAQILNRKGDAYLKRKGPSEFHIEAENLLKSSELADFFDYQELVEASFEPSFNKKQNFKTFEFSDLPLTLARGESCFVDLYFWRRRPTVIHNHHFTGAFQCLRGSNVDLEFSFKKKTKLTKYFSMGEIKLENTRLLKRGDTAAIPLLDKFIHQNHHQDDLTINVCFRTPELIKKNLSNYLFSGLRFEKDGELLARVERLLKFSAIDDFNFKNLKLTLDDALWFLMQMHGRGTQNKRLLELEHLLNKRVNSELKISIHSLIEVHEKELNEIQDQYD